MGAVHVQGGATGAQGPRWQHSGVWEGAGTATQVAGDGGGRGPPPLVVVAVGLVLAHVTAVGTALAVSAGNPQEQLIGGVVKALAVVSLNWSPCRSHLGCIVGVGRGA